MMYFYFSINKCLLGVATFSLAATHVFSFASTSSQQFEATSSMTASTSSLRMTESSSGNFFFASSLSTSTSGSSSANVVSQQQRPDMEAYSSGYRTVFEELPVRSCSPAVGTIPNDLIGTYYRCGPAMFSAGSIKPPKKSIVQPKTPPVPDGEDPERMVLHPFEGDGAVLGVTFYPVNNTHQATARFRFIRTAGFTNERKKGRKLYTGMDGTRQLGSPNSAKAATAGALGNDIHFPLFRHHLLPGLNKLRKNTSNTRAVYWGNRLITLWEGALPYKLDAISLSTDGRSQLGGRKILKENDAFGAKMVMDPKAKSALFYGNDQGAANSDITVYEFNYKFRLVEEQGGKRTYRIPGFAMVSDFCATTNYAIFVTPKINVNPMQFVVGKEPGKTLSVAEDEPALLHLVARASSMKSSKTMQVPFDGIIDAELQFINAYEDDDKSIIIDVIRSDGKKKDATSANNRRRWPWATSLPEYSAMSSKKSLWRYTIDTRTSLVTKELLSDNQVFFGIINPAVSTQKHKFLYMNVGSLGTEIAPPQGIAKYDCVLQQMTQTWIPKEYEFCGEPMYAPRSKLVPNEDDNEETSAEMIKTVVDEKEEDDGYILSVLYNGRTQESEIVVLLASDIARGPVTRIPLGMRVPHGYFGCYTTQAAWPEDMIERRAKLADKMESKGNMWNEVKSDFSGLGLRLDDIEEIFPDLA